MLLKLILIPQQHCHYKQYSYCCILGFHMTSDCDNAVFVSLRVLEMVFFWWNGVFLGKYAPRPPPPPQARAFPPTNKVFPISVSLRTCIAYHSNIIYLGSRFLRCKTKTFPLMYLCHISLQKQKFILAMYCKTTYFKSPFIITCILL